MSDLITSTTVRLEKKGVDACFIDNHMNLFLTGNRIGVFKLDPTDRRLAVFMAFNGSAHAAQEIANVSDYWGPRWAWAQAEGPAALYQWFLDRDLSDFNAHGQAPMTEAKLLMLRAHQSSEAQFVSDLRRDPDAVLGEDRTGYVATARELCWVMQGERRPQAEISGSAVMRMGQELSRAGFEVANEGRQIWDRVTRCRGRFYVIRDLPKMILDPGEWVELVRMRAGWDDE